MEPKPNPDRVFELAKKIFEQVILKSQSQQITDIEELTPEQLEDLLREDEEDDQQEGT